MTMAAAMQSRTAESPARSKASRIAHVDIVTDLAEAETVWRAFEESGHLFTPYQRFDLLSGRVSISRTRSPTPAVLLSS